MTLQHRRLLLADLLATHLNDDSKWVRMSAFQILGPFISTFAKQFTEVTYNQHGELVFTSQQDTRFRYKKMQLLFIHYFIYSIVLFRFISFSNLILRFIFHPIYLFYDPLIVFFFLFFFFLKKEKNISILILLQYKVFVRRYISH